MSYNKIVNVGIRLTKKCNMNCTYCNVKESYHKDLCLSDWKRAVDIIKKLGVNDIVLLGGEPTLYSDIVDLVDYIVNEAKINCSLTTNAFNNLEIVERLIETEITFLGVSVDNLNIQKSISPLKAKNGLKMIDFLIEKNYHNIVNYIVLNKNNVVDIIDLIEYMESKKVSSYILPFHWGNEGKFEHRKNNERYAFISDLDLRQYYQTIDKIVEMKKSGYHIKNSIDFLKQSKKYIKDM